MNAFCVTLPDDCQIVSNIFGLKSHCARIKPSRNADEALIHLFGQHAAVEREASRGPSVMSSVNGRKARDTHTTPRTPSSAHAHQNSIDATRLPQVLIVSDLEQGNRHTHLAIGDMLRSRKVCVSRREMGAGDTIEGLPTAREQPMPSSSTASQVPAEGRHVFDLPDDFICIWVRSTSIDAKTPPPWLVDRFAFKCRASQLAEPTVGINLHAAIPPEYVAMLRSLALKTHMHPPLRAHISNLFSALHGHPKLSANITSSSITSFKSFIRIARVLFRPFDWSPAEIDPGVKGRAYDQRRKLVERADWFATDDDIREVFGNLVEFRVRLRRASEEVMWPLKGGADGIELELANDSSRVRQRDFDHARLEQVHVQLILRRILDIV